MSKNSKLPKDVLDYFNNIFNAPAQYEGKKFKKWIPSENAPQTTVNSDFNDPHHIEIFGKGWEPLAEMARDNPENPILKEALYRLERNPDLRKELLQKLIEFKADENA